MELTAPDVTEVRLRQNVGCTSRKDRKYVHKRGEGGFWPSHKSSQNLIFLPSQTFKEHCTPKKALKGLRYASTHISQEMEKGIL